MKWFKHISDSLDDPFIFDLMTKHGADGYLVFFGILEIYAREFSPEDSWNLRVSLSYLKQKFHKTHKQLITNPLQTISNSGKWSILFEEEHITIYIPKFKHLLDNYTRNTNPKQKEKLASVLQETFQPIKNKEERIKKEIRTFVVPTIGEITSYCLERKNAVNPETWLNHYTSNGWMVGKNKMKDWKASVRTWEAKDGRGHDSKGGFGIQAEYKEQRPELSEEQRRANVERARKLAGAIGGMPGKV
jgi:hypothetical protein